ncbi:MAG: hypothetical protein R2939_05890 [Kofleriaceae bacterium]
MSDDELALTPRRDYLQAHRRLIVGRALAGAVAGAVSLPLVDDWLVQRVLGSGYRKIAADHQVDLDADAVTHLVHGASQPTSWGNLTTGAIVYRLAAGNWRRLLLTVTTARRAQAAARTFVAMTLFDHYCARCHTGLGLGAGEATRVRATILAAIEQTPGGLTFEPFRRGARSAARALVRAPLELADIATGGALRRRLGRGDAEPAEAVEVSALEQAIERALADQQGLLAKASTAIELNLMAETNPYLDAVIATFDRLWAAEST